MKTKPVLILDIDDVQVYCNTPLQAWHNREYGTSILCDAEVINYDLSRIWGCSRDEVWRRILEFYKDPLFENAPLIPGVQEFVPQLANKYTIFSITARPLSTKEITQEHHLKDLEGYIERVYYREEMGGNKGALATTLGAVLAIDDAEHYIGSYLSAGITPVLFNFENSFGWNSADRVLPGTLTSDSWEKNYDHALCLLEKSA